MTVPRSFAVAALLFSAASFASTPVIPDPPAVAARAYVLMDYQTGELLAQENANERLGPSSLTKMMTSYVIGTQLKNGKIALEDQVLVSEKAWAKNFPGSSLMFIKVGDYVSVDLLNRGIIIQSGNDACVAMAEHIAGSEDAFAQLMNGYAQEIGMNGSHFVNSHGLPAENHYTTAYDMARLGSALIRDLPEEYAIYADKSFEYNGITQMNRNLLLWDKSLNVDGIKTGHTRENGYSLVSSATQGDMRLVAVVMGTASEKARKEESKKLLTWGFRFFETLTPYEAGHEFQQSRVWFGSDKSVAIGVDQQVAITLPRGRGADLKADFTLDSELLAPLTSGQRVGTVRFYLDDKVVAEKPLVALADVPEAGFLSRLWDHVLRFFTGLFS